MLNYINKTYILSSILLYVTLSLKISGEYLLINFFTIFSIISYFTILHINFSMPKQLYKKTYLNIEVFLYVFVFVSLQNFISYFYTNNFFIFSDSDAIFYHESTISILDMSFIDGIKHYLTYMDFDDLGIILVLYPLYYIAESNLMLNIFYLLVAVVTANSIFQISQSFMSKKYAFLSSLSYSLSSFVLFFHSSGLKESLMVMFVVLSFDFYYRFVTKKSISNLIVALIFMGALLLFRPAIPTMIIGAIGLSAVFSKKGGVAIKVVSFFIFIFLLVMSDAILLEIEKYTTGGIDTLMEAREVQGMIIGGIPFTYAVNILSQSIGPIPTIISSEKILTMFYISGLIYRILLAFPFWFGIVYIYKTKNYIMYPLTLFIIIEMSALTFLMDGLELRKAIPHIPFVFIIAFWFLDKYDNKIIKFKRDKRFKRFFKFSMFLLIFILFAWNFR